MASFLRVICIVSLSFSLFGKDLGTYGHTFIPEEEDLLFFLCHKFEDLSDADRDRIRSQMNDHYTKMLLEPAPVKAVAETKTYRHFNFDPTISVKQDILDHQKKIIVSKGSSYNPLLHMHYEKPLLFFDATKESHLAWAKKQPSKSHWILVKGRPLDLEESENRPVFFDQHGKLTQWIGIKHVPARVIQEGSILKIEEIVVKEDGCEIQP